MLAPGAHAVTTDDVVRLPTSLFWPYRCTASATCRSDLFAGKILVDAMNYWEEIDGVDEELATAPRGTSVVVQQQFPSARVVKSLNHLGYFKFEQGRRPTGRPVDRDGGSRRRPCRGRRCACSSSIGSDSTRSMRGDLTPALALQPDGPVFGIGHSADELSKLLLVH